MAFIIHSTVSQLEQTEEVIPVHSIKTKVYKDVKSLPHGTTQHCKNASCVAQRQTRGSSSAISTLKSIVVMSNFNLRSVMQIPDRAITSCCDNHKTPNTSLRLRSTVLSHIHINLQMAIRSVKMSPCSQEGRTSYHHAAQVEVCTKVHLCARLRTQIMAPCRNLETKQTAADSSAIASNSLS